MNDDSFYSAQRKLLQQENSTCIKSFSKETFPSMLMILVLFPLRVLGLLDRDHTYRGTRRAFLLNFQGEVSTRKHNEHHLDTNAIFQGEQSVSSEILSCLFLLLTPANFSPKHIISSLTLSVYY